MNKRKLILEAAVAGILSGMFAISNASADDTANNANKRDVEKCYGVVKAGHGSCGGKGHSCAGENKCNGEGWVNVEKGHCLDIDGASLTPIPNTKDTEKK